MTESDRLLIQRAYISICRASKFTIDPVNGAILAGKVLKRSPLEVWIACGWSVMERLAAGTHPALNDPRFK